MKLEYSQGCHTPERNRKLCAAVNVELEAVFLSELINGKFLRIVAWTYRNATSHFNHNLILHMWMCTYTYMRACTHTQHTCFVNFFNLAPTRHGADYQIFQNIEQYPYSLKFLQVIFFCYSSYTLAAHLSQKYSIWIISFSCWVRGIMAPFYVCQIFSVSTRDGEGPGSLDQESS